jgi:hypothetical protein
MKIALMNLKAFSVVSERKNIQLKETKLKVINQQKNLDIISFNSLSGLSTISGENLAFLLS